MMDTLQTLLENISQELEIIEGIYCDEQVVPIPPAIITLPKHMLSRDKTVVKSQPQTATKQKGIKNQPKITLDTTPVSVVEASLILRPKVGHEATKIGV